MGQGIQKEYAIHAVTAPSITSKLTFKSGKFASARKPDTELTVNCVGETIVHNKVAYTCAFVTGRSASEEANADWWKRDIVEKRRDCNRGYKRVVGDGRGGLTVAEPSLLNVNVRHLLLRLYDPLLFVCICGTGAAWWRSRRRKGRIEKTEKEQASPTGVELFVWFLPLLSGACLFFYFGLLCTPLPSLLPSPSPPCRCSA